MLKIKTKSDKMYEYSLFRASILLCLKAVAMAVEAVERFRASQQLQQLVWTNQAHFLICILRAVPVLQVYQWHHLLHRRWQQL